MESRERGNRGARLGFGFSQPQDLHPKNPMKTNQVSAFLVAMFAACTVVSAQEEPTAKDVPEMPPMAEPAKEHSWLQQFVGEWESTTELDMGPGQPPMTCKGTQSARMVGGFWMIEEGSGDFPGMGTVSSVLTIGYDAAKKKFIGTWIDSTNDFLWHYEGDLDSTGTKLSLESKGPNPMKPGTTAQFRDAVEFVSKDHRILTSSVREGDGDWVQMMAAHYRRKASQ
jgi:hypothetical protein